MIESIKVSLSGSELSLNDLSVEERDCLVQYLTPIKCEGFSSEQRFFFDNHYLKASPLDIDEISLVLSGNFRLSFFEHSGSFYTNSEILSTCGCNYNPYSPIKKYIENFKIIRLSL
jgi:hypothetical protein